jgi:hypothetical protein
VKNELVEVCSRLRAARRLKSLVTGSGTNTPHHTRGMKDEGSAKTETKSNREKTWRSRSANTKRNDCEVQGQVISTDWILKTG